MNELMALILSIGLLGAVMTIMIILTTRIPSHPRCFCCRKTAVLEEGMRCEECGEG